MTSKAFIADMMEVWEASDDKVREQIIIEVLDTVKGNNKNDPNSHMIKSTLDLTSLGVPKSPTVMAYWKRQIPHLGRAEGPRIFQYFPIYSKLVANLHVGSIPQDFRSRLAARVKSVVDAEEKLKNIQLAAFPIESNRYTAVYKLAHVISDEEVNVFGIIYKVSKNWVFGVIFGGRLTEDVCDPDAKIDDIKNYVDITKDKQIDHGITFWDTTISVSLARSRELYIQKMMEKMD